MEKKMCILYDGKVCDNCGECNMCDLDPKKVCDSCGVCLDMDDDYSTVDVDLVYENEDEPELLSFEELFPDEAFGGSRDDYDDVDEDEDFEDYDDSDDFDNPDGFYDEDEYADYDDEDDLNRDFGDFFGKSRF